MTMSRSVDETRRDFLKRLARAAAFVPPALVTLRPSEARAQKKAGGSGVTPPGQSQTQGSFRLDPSQGNQQDPQPWNPGRSAGTPPWAEPPPTAGGDD